MDNKNNMDECMWMIMGSIHESDRITVAKATILRLPMNRTCLQ